MLCVSAYFLRFHKFDVLIKAKPMKIKVVLYHLRAIILYKLFDILLKYNIHAGKKIHISVSSVNFHQMNLILCIQDQELEHYLHPEVPQSLTIQVPKATTFLTCDHHSLALHPMNVSLMYSLILLVFELLYNGIRLYIFFDSRCL